MSHRTTFEQMLRVRTSLHRMQCYIAKLRVHLEQQTPGHSVIGWAEKAMESVHGFTIHFEHWSGGTEGGCFTGWEDEERERRAVEVNSAGDGSGA